MFFSHFSIKNIFTSYLSHLHVKYTNSFSDNFFGEHPHKYSLFGLSKMLSEYNINNLGIRVKNKKQDIFDIDTPFIAHIEDDFIIVYKVTTNEVFYTWRGKNIKVPFEEFEKVWTGVALLAEPNENSIEPNYKENRKIELFEMLKNKALTLLIFSFTAILYFLHKSYTSIGLTASLFVNFIGLFASYLLILKQVNIHSEYGDKICSLFKQSDCNNILESKAAKFLGVISWSEVGLGYFISNIIVLITLPQLATYTAIINMCALPYSFWSVWYQKFRAKQWCPLCLIIQLILWTLFGINIGFGILQNLTFSFTNLLLISCIYIIPYLILNILLSKLSDAGKVEQLIQEINSIKADENVFATLLKKQVCYNVDKNTSQIYWGNPDATILVTILTNPHCNPCALMHERVEKLLEQTNGNLCVQYIFSSFNDELSLSNKALIAAYLNNNTDLTKTIFNEWFKRGKFNKEEFLKKYNINFDDTAIEEEFLKHEEWKQEIGLRATPTILVNGYKLPDNYKIEDLRYISKLYL